ncbi:MAG: hypothetical protein U9Q81_15390 [Pseudomonadota bacterium]|nr:hypothetical protein [Pseudomonadota bacterium]
MSNRTYIVGALVLGLAIIFLWSGDEEPDSTDTGVDSESSVDSPPVLREPESLTPERDYGIARTPRWREEPSAYGTERPYYYAYPQEPVSPYPQEYQTQDPAERFHFRPLGEREQQRLQAERPRPPSYPDLYVTPEAPAPQLYTGRPPYPQNQWGGYSFRPRDESPAAKGRWKGPYRDRSWDGEQGYADQWAIPPNPQWGSSASPSWAPPAQRMYPSLHPDSYRKLTAR